MRQQLFIAVESSPTFATSLKVATLLKPDFRAIDTPAQNKILRKIAIQGHSRLRIYGSVKGDT